MATENVSTIGSGVGRDYANLVDWKNDFGVGLEDDLVTADILQVAEIYNDNGAGAAAISGNPLINPSVTVDSTHYLVIRAAAGETTPLFDASGDDFDGIKTTHTGGCMRVSVQYTRIERIYFVSTHTGSSFIRCLRLNAANCIVDSCAAQMTGGTNDALIGFSNESGGRADFVDCIARGSAGSPGTTGLTVGFWDQGLGETVALNCGAYNIDQANANPSPPPIALQIGIGFFFGVSTSYCKNCWAFDCGEADFDLHASSPSSYNASSDSTASGTGSLTGLTSGDVLVAPRTGFYRPEFGSVLVNAGDDVSADWPTADVVDITGTDHDDDGGGWEIGPYEASISIVPSGIASAEAFGTAALEVHVSPTGIESLEAFGDAVVNPGIVSVTATGIESLEAFGDATLSTSVDVTSVGIESLEAFGDAALIAGVVSVTPTGIASAEVFGSVTVTAGTALVSPPSIASAEAFGAAVLAPGLVTVTPSSIGSAEAFGSPALVPSAVAISPGSVASAEAFGTAVVSSGAIIVQPGGISSAEAFGAAVISAGASSLLPSGIASAESFGTPALQSTVDILASSIAPSELWGMPTAIPSIEMVSPTGIASAEAFGSPTLTLLVALVSPTSIPSEEIWGQAQLLIIGQSRDVSPAGILSGERWGHPFLTGGVIPVTLKELIQNALIDAGKQGTFLDATYDPDLCTLSSGLQRTPSSIEANEVSSVFKTENRHGRKVLQDRSQWQWLLILQFEEEVILQPFEDQLLENPICIERDISSGVTRQVILKLLDVSPKHPPRQGASNGTQAHYRFSAELSSL